MLLDLEHYIRKVDDTTTVRCLKALASVNGENMDFNARFPPSADFDSGDQLTPFLLACYLGRKKTVDFMLSMHADPSITAKVLPKSNTDVVSLVRRDAKEWTLLGRDHLHTSEQNCREIIQRIEFHAWNENHPDCFRNIPEIPPNPPVLQRYRNQLKRTRTVRPHRFQSTNSPVDQISETDLLWQIVRDNDEKLSTLSRKMHDMTLKVYSQSNIQETEPHVPQNTVTQAANHDNDNFVDVSSTHSVNTSMSQNSNKKVVCLDFDDVSSSSAESAD